MPTCGPSCGCSRTSAPRTSPCSTRTTRSCAPADLPGRGRREWFSRDQSDRIDWQHAGIRGQHNLENALAAALAAEAIGVSLADRDRALREFTAPPHRLELVATRDGVSFVNDSKATNPEAAMMALTAFDDGIRLILGGSLKGASFVELAEAVADGPVAGVYLIGEAAGAIAAELDERGVAHTDSGDLATAVAQAAADASPGDTVLLSPACASLRPVPRLRAPRRRVPPARRGGARWRLRRRPRRRPRRRGGRAGGGARRSRRSSTTC